MDILIDSDGYQWRMRGDSTQVSVERRAPNAKKPTDDPASWVIQSYHNRIEHGLSWLLDHLVRTELDAVEMQDFVALVEGMKRALEKPAAAWRREIEAAPSNP